MLEIRILPNIFQVHAESNALKMQGALGYLNDSVKKSKKQLGNISGV